MRKRSSIKGKEKNLSLEAINGSSLEQMIGKNPAAVELGRLGGKIGGLIRAERLTPEERSRIAREAAKARWAKIETSENS